MGHPRLRKTSFLNDFGEEIVLKLPQFIGDKNVPS
jgi:hypothetical protein